MHISAAGLITDAPHGVVVLVFAALVASENVLCGQDQWLRSVRTSDP
jgi:hypothetical protein